MAELLTVEQGRQLTQAVSDLLVQAEASAALLADVGGNIIAQSPTRAENETIAALAAGSFSATRELAALSGEPSFHSIIHEGHGTSIYLQSVAENYILLVIFQKTTTTGLVKLYTQKTARELESKLAGISKQEFSDSECAVAFEIDESAAVFDTPTSDLKNI
jgi:predicted regulator of Ras-like GTPase activity (Roadblock/LC7/MglB family)